jgi:predicted KAP-like P-loop ATPase
MSASMPTDPGPPPRPRGVHGDSPVGRDGDQLGRRPFARLIARQIQVNRPTDGLVVAVVGKWGSGKTSVLRMIAEELAEPLVMSGDTPSQTVVLQFNPWLFSGSEQLTAIFFVTLADQLRAQSGSDASTAVSERLRRYGAALGTLRALPGIGGIFGAGADLAGEAARRADPFALDLSGQRSKLAETLRESDLHLVVLIDDVDRLQPETEIPDLVRMVKLVGDLPGVTYVLSYDRRPVVSALTAADISGEEYLEKIVQVEHRLPEVSRERLSEMLLLEVNAAIRHLPDERLDNARWPEVFAKIIQPLVTTPRHVRRYANSLQLSLDLHGEEVDLVDQLALAALATFLPSLHNELPALASVLLPNDSIYSAMFPDRDKESAKARLEGTAEACGEQEIASATYSLLFPRTDRFLQNTDHGRSGEREAQRRRRVADPEAFWTYLTAAIPEEGVTVAEVRQLLDAMKDSGELIKQLERRDATSLARLMDRMRSHITDVPTDYVQQAARALIVHSLERFGSATPTEFDHPLSHIEWLVADLVSHLPSETRHAFLTRWASEETVPTRKLAVYQVCRYKTDSGEALIGNDNLAAIQAQLAEVVCAAHAEELVALGDIGRLLWLAGEHLERNDRGSLHARLEDDRLFVRYLLIFCEPSFHGEPRALQWIGLKEHLGGEWLAARIARVSPEVELTNELAEALESARGHLAADRATAADTAG